MTSTFEIAVQNFHTIFLDMLTICVHELNIIGAFFLDPNYLETQKVMTVTFDLENGKRRYLIKFGCILYLYAKFDGCSLKTVYVANLYIT